jgi:hypothetical protein
MTDAEAEGAPFRLGYLEDVSILCGLPLAETLALAERFEAEVAAHPQQAGWVYNGHLVAPATVDPYLRIMPVARRIFDTCGVFPSETDRTRLLDGILYKYNYQKTSIAFRPGALAALLALEGTATYVVTNSHTEPVVHKIRVLGGDTGQLDWLLDRVYGRAKKYQVDEDFEAVPAAMRVEGLSRPVLLRRRHYYEVLDRLLKQHGLGWDDLLVVGDIFELDLALPLAMGARIGLVVNDFTPEYERRFVAGHARGHLVSALAEIPGLMTQA